MAHHMSSAHRIALLHAVLEDMREQWKTEENPQTKYVLEMQGKKLNHLYQEMEYGWVDFNKKR